MKVTYINEDGLQVFRELSEKPTVIGRSPDADLVIEDAKVSRFHCGIRLENGQATIKDLESRNGTFVNGERIGDPVVLHIGDHIRVGASLLIMEKKLSKGNATILHEIEEEMGHGKGYNTLLREIVEPGKNEKE